MTDLLYNRTVFQNQNLFVSTHFMIGQRYNRDFSHFKFISYNSIMLNSDVITILKYLRSVLTAENIQFLFLLPF